MAASLNTEGRTLNCTEGHECTDQQDCIHTSLHGVTMDQQDDIKASLQGLESDEDMVVKLEVVDSETSSDQTVFQVKAMRNVTSVPSGAKFIITDAFEDEQLIEEVKKSPILYDKNHLSFKDLDRKREVWEDVGEQIGMDGEIAKKRWINIRDAFQAYLSRLIAAKRASRTIKEYKYAHLLDFLLEHMKKGRSFKDVMQATESSSAGFSSLNTLPPCTSVAPDISESGDRVVNIENGKKCDGPSNSLTELRYKRKRQLQSPVSRPRLKYRRIMRAPALSRDDDDDDDGTQSFFKAMIASVCKLPNRAKAEVKLQIHQIVQQAELKYLYLINDPQVSQGPSRSNGQDSVVFVNQCKGRNVEVSPDPLGNIQHT